MEVTEDINLFAPSFRFPSYATSSVADSNCFNIPQGPHHYLSLEIPHPTPSPGCILLSIGAAAATQPIRVRPSDTCAIRGLLLKQVIKNRPCCLETAYPGLLESG